MLLSGLSPRLGRLVRLAALGFILWSVIAVHPHPGVGGRGLAVLVLLVLAVVGWVRWLLARELDGPLTWDAYLMAAAGGALLGASPHSAASGFVFAGTVAAALRADLDRAWVVPALGTLTLAVTVLIWNSAAIGLLAYTLGFAASLLAASNARTTRLKAEQSELLLAQTQRSQEERLRAARLEESTRIAREIHDVLAHSLAGLTIQLEATSALLEGGADREQILARVRRAHELARDGLRETRRAVGALRGEGPQVPRAIEALVADLRAATGGPIELAIRGGPERLSGAGGQTVLRVVQEALTNAAKHAPGASVRIRIDAGQAGTEVVVENGAGRVPVGAGPLADSGGGYGLAGMRERAQALGGTLAAGPDGAGWRVALTIPAEATRR